MEYNLENFPVKGTPQAYERWGKGFKKGLQKRSDQVGKFSFTRKIILEILGKKIHDQT